MLSTDDDDALHSHDGEHTGAAHCLDLLLGLPVEESGLLGVFLVLLASLLRDGGGVVLDVLPAEGREQRHPVHADRRHGFAHKILVFLQ